MKNSILSIHRLITPIALLAIVCSLPERVHGQATTNVWGASSGLWTDAAAWASNGVPLTNVTTTGDHSIARFTNTSMVTVSNAAGASNTVRLITPIENAKVTFDANGGFLGSGANMSAGNGYEVVFTNGNFGISLAAVGVGRSGAQVSIAGASTVFDNVTLNSDGSTVGRGLAIGQSSGSNNQIRIESGAVFNTVGGFIGYILDNTNPTTAASLNNSVVVSGAGSTWNNTAAASYVGRVASNSAINTLVSGNSLVVEEGGAVSWRGTTYVGNNPATDAGAIVANNELLVRSGGSFETGVLLIGWTTSANTSSNLVTLSGGSISLTNTGENVRVFAGAGNGNTLEVTGGTLTAANAVNIGTSGNAGQANLKMDGGTINAGVLTIGATYGRFADGTAEAGFNGGTLNVSNLVHGRNTLFTLGDADSASVATLNLLGGTTNRLTAGLLVNSDGVLTGNGVIAADTAGSTATFIRNAGTISADGQTLRLVGSLTNQSGSTLSVSNGGAFLASEASTNAGTVNIGSGSAATFSNGLSSAGSLIVDGTLTGATTIASGGVLSGSGTMASAVTIGNGGTLAIGNSPGTMTFNENLTLDLNSTSLFEINGFTAGQFDLAQGGVGTQAVTFGGTLSLVFANGFNTLGDVKIFDFENYSGSFAGFNSTGLADGYTASFNEANGLVTVVPEPSTYALLALSAVGLAAHMVRRRRRG